MKWHFRQIKYGLDGEKWVFHPEIEDLLSSWNTPLTEPKRSKVKKMQFAIIAVTFYYMNIIQHQFTAFGLKA